MEELKYKAKNGVELTYIEDPFPVQNFIGEQKLLVIFQSLGDEKSDDLKKRFPYTLINGLRFYNCRKLYIKDDHGLAGTYYLGLNGKLDIKQAVIELIQNKMIGYKISKENLTMLGFSKGGYAALMFAFEIGAKNVITAVPQVDLTSWIYKYKPFLAYILPENPTESDEKFYKNFLLDIIRNSHYNPNIYLVSSYNDNTYNDHIPLLLDVLAEKGITPNVYLNNELCVTRHNNVVINSMNEILAILGMVLADKKISSFFNSNNNYENNK